MCITFGAAQSSLRRAATCHVRTLLPGPEGVRSWQVLLYIKTTFTFFSPSEQTSCPSSSTLLFQWTHLIPNRSSYLFHPPLDCLTSSILLSTVLPLPSSFPLSYLFHPPLHCLTSSILLSTVLPLPSSSPLSYLFHPPFHCLTSSILLSTVLPLPSSSPLSYLFHPPLHCLTSSILLSVVLPLPSSSPLSYLFHPPLRCLTSSILLSTRPFASDALERYCNAILRNCNTIFDFQITLF